MIGVLFTTLLACSYQALYSIYHPVDRQVETTIVSKLTEIKPPAVIHPPDPILPPKPKGTPDPKLVTTATIVPANTDHAADTIPTNDMLAMATVSDHAGGTSLGSAGTEAGTDIAIAVHAPPAPLSSEPVSVAEFMPEYPGGEQAMMKFLGDNINYPTPDREMGIQGRVTVGFIIDENGKVSDIKVLKGLTRTLNEESIRVVSKLKTFKPGVQNGHPVKVRFTLPINYQLRED
jgi:protein TonB